MHLLSAQGGTYITIQTHKTAFNSLERARGFKSYFADKPAYKMLELEMQNISGGENFLEQSYREHADIRGIFVVNDAIHRIANFVSQLGRKSQTILIGYDLIDQKPQGDAKRKGGLPHLTKAKFPRVYSCVSAL